MTIDERRNDKGKLIGWKVRVCVGREGNKQKWKALTINADDPAFDEISGNGKRAENARAMILERLANDFEKAAKEEFINQQEAKGKNPDAVIMDKRKITLTQYVRNMWWRDVLASKPRPNTLSFYKYTSDNICEYFDSLPKAQQRLYKMEPRTVKDFINYLQSEAVGKDGNPLSETTILRHWQTFRNIINSALRDEYIQRDPCLNFKPTDKPSTPRFDGGYMTIDQARTFIKLLDHLDDGKSKEKENDSLHWRCMMNLLLQHGLRRGEACGLRWADIKTNKEDGQEYYTLDICHSVTPDASAEEKVHIDDPKTRESRRTILIQPEIYKMLMDLKAKREQDYNIKLLPSSTMYIFCKDGNPEVPMYPTAPTRWLSRFVKKNDLPDISPHDLRRTWATLANEAGINQKAMQFNLGHSDGADTTSRHYTKLTLAGQINTLNTMHTVFYGEDKDGSEIKKA